MREGIEFVMAAIHPSETRPRIIILSKQYETFLPTKPCLLVLTEVEAQFAQGHWICHSSRLSIRGLTQNYVVDTVAVSYMILSKKYETFLPTKPCLPQNTKKAFLALF